MPPFTFHTLQFRKPHARGQCMFPFPAINHNAGSLAPKPIRALKHIDIPPYPHASLPLAPMTPPFPPCRFAHHETARPSPPRSLYPLGTHQPIGSLSKYPPPGWDTIFNRYGCSCTCS
ncbi:hypothetical protein IF2G_05879 [Cordyceps javanica]|nr:hypothetical protein IF2G_05879 [Cordyceps javanica]